MVEGRRSKSKKRRGRRNGGRSSGFHGVRSRRKRMTRPIEYRNTVDVPRGLADLSLSGRKYLWVLVNLVGIEVPNTLEGIRANRRGRIRPGSEVVDQWGSVRMRVIK
jgi:hypothetical protein